MYSAAGGASLGQIRQEQQPNPEPEPPRWFTARRELLKFKSAFKTGLARCPAPPPAAGTAARDTAAAAPDRSLSLQHSRRASDGFPASAHFLGAPVASYGFRVRPSVRLSRELSPSHHRPLPCRGDSPQRTRAAKSSRRSSVKMPKETTRTTLRSDRTLSASAPELFSPGVPRRRFSGPTTDDGHLSRGKAAAASISSRFFRGKFPRISSRPICRRYAALAITRGSRVSGLSAGEGFPNYRGSDFLFLLLLFFLSFPSLPPTPTPGDERRRGKFSCQERILS